MVSLDGFDANKIPERHGFDAIPAGTYLMVVSESEQKNAKTVPNKYLELTLEVIDGMHQGRRVWVRLNLWNSSSSAVQIATKELGEIARACGIPKPGDSSKLHNIPILVSVAIAKEEYNGQKQNKVVKYEPNGKFSETITPENTPAPPPVQELPDGQPGPAPWQIK